MLSGRQQDIEESILLMLYEESELTARRLKSREIAGKFTSPAGETRVVAGLEHLQKRHLVSGSFDNFSASGFVITREGIVHVENYYAKTEDGENTSWVRREHSPDDGLEVNDKIFASFPNVLSNSETERVYSTGIHIHNTFAPVNTVSHDTASEGADRSAARAGWFSAWVAFLTALVALAAFLWTLREAKVF